MKKRSKAPEQVDLTETEGEALIKRLNDSNLSTKDRQLLSHIVRLYFWLIFRLQESKLSLKRLKEALFGKPAKNNDKKDTDVTDEASNKESESGSESAQKSDDQKACHDPLPPKPKHPGPLQPSDYRGATTKVCEHERLAPGDQCPTCGMAPLQRKTPQVSVRIDGNPLFSAQIESIERLACEGCGDIFYAKPPQAKYSEQANAVLAYHHYGMGLPFHRIEHSQAMQGLPFPDATQWDQIAKLSPVVSAIFGALEHRAAQSRLIYQDDTGVKIQDLIKENQSLGKADRTGMFTTALVCVSDQMIVLYYSGRKHAGENLAGLLQQRDDALPPPIQMCDGSSSNKVSMLTILCGCLSHGVRKFKDLVDWLPSEAQRVLIDLKQVYEYDKQTQALSEAARLAFHQKHSQPILDQLKVYIDTQLKFAGLEPRGSLANAYQYLQNHWFELTQFLRVLGAPLDNNLVERLLKLMIRRRKASYFFKSTRSADIGSMIVSLIATAEQSNVNVIDYLTQLQLNEVDVLNHPERWLPWCYQDNLAQSLVA